MSFCQINWFSNTLRKAIDTWVILPNQGDGPFPVFYLLHGISDDHTSWMRRSRIEWYVRELPLIVVMPDGGRGFYTDHINGPKWGTYIAQELPDFIERTFPARKDAGGRAVGGLSMGGYGALRVALGNPGRYASVNCHSGPLDIGHVLQQSGKDPQWQAEREAMLGDSVPGGPFDLYELTKHCLEINKLPAIKIDHGTEDWLLPQARSYVAFLKELGIPHQYDEYPGDHNWDFWDTHIQEALQFHIKNLT